MVAVEDGAVPKAVETLLGSKLMDAIEHTAVQVDDLAAIPPPDEEHALIDAEVQLGMEQRPKAAVPREQHVRRASWAVGERRKAARGPSGWRNSYI